MKTIEKTTAPPSNSRARVRAWCLRFARLHANFAVYGAVCFLIAGRNLFEAAAAGAVTSPLFLLAGQVFWKAGFAARAVRERRRGAE